MKMPMHIVALRTTKYSDKNSILTAYSLEYGRVAFLLPAGSGREAVRRRALLMPLSVAECIADMRPGREIHAMSEPRSVMPLLGLRSHPVKGAVALFVAEVVTRVVRDGEPDEALFRFIVSSVEMLDLMPGERAANFHICFLYCLGRFIGIEPDVDGYSYGMLFDMLDGTFRRTAPLHKNYLDVRESAALAALSRMTYLNMHLFRMTRKERNAVVDTILRYYSMHHTAMSGLHGLDVLRMLF